MAEIKNNHFDLIIIGGGLAGASLACALKYVCLDTALKIAVVEAHQLNTESQPSYDDRTVALSYGSRCIFGNMGLWSSLEPVAEAIDSIHISDRGHFGVTCLTKEQEGVEALGYVLENRSIGQQLYAAMSANINDTQKDKAGSNISLFCPAELIALKQDKQQVAIEILIDKYFVRENIINAGYPLDMRYAGPREGLLHATFRQNYGVSKMIIGRDHAGVGDFYGLFDAQDIFDEIPTSDDPGKNLLCQPLKIDWTFYCYKCDGMASLRTCPHGKEDRVLLSGTMLRKGLSEGAEIPEHFGRDEVLAILREYYGGRTATVEIKLHGAATGV